MADQSEEARAADLSTAHVLALRLYTTSTFQRINGPLRERKRPHPLGMTVWYIADGIKKLRAVAANENPAEFNTTVSLWRGLKDMRVADQQRFLEKGGTEARAHTARYPTSTHLTRST